MKAVYLLIYLIVLCYTSDLSAQITFVVGDTCDNYYTTYTPINDSVQKVTLIFGDIKLYEGFIIRPYRYIHLGTNMSDGKANIYNTGWKLDSLSIYRNSNGQILEWCLYKHGLIKERKLYENESLIFHHYIRKNIEYTRRYENGQLMSSEAYYPEKHLLITKDETGKYKFGTGQNKYERQFIYGNKTITRDRSRNGDKVITYYFDKTFIVKKKVAYSSGKLSSIEAFDKKGRTIKLIQYEKGKIRDIQTRLYIVDSFRNTLITTNISKKYHQKNSTSEYTINKKNATIQYNKDSSRYFVSHINDHWTLRYSNLKKAYSTDISIYIYTPKINDKDWKYESGDIPDDRSIAYSVQKTDEYEIRSMVNNYQMNPYFHSIYTGYSNTYLIKGLVNEFLYDRSDLANLYNRFSSNNSKGRCTDSIFKDGKLH